MTFIWTEPHEQHEDKETAIKWWLGEHFVQAPGLEDAVWAIDLYASYLDACVQTGKLPIVTCSRFGRVVGQLVPRSEFRNTSKDGQRKSGHQYLVNPKEGVKVFHLPSNNKSGAQAARELYIEAAKNTKTKAAWEWTEWDDLKRRERGVVEAWLAARGMVGSKTKAPPAEPIQCQHLHGEFLNSYNWTYQRFNKALGRVAKVDRSGDGSRKVVFVIKKGAAA